MHAQQTCTHLCTCTCMHFNIRLTDVEQDDSEDGDGKQTEQHCMSAVTTGVSVLSGQDPSTFGWVGLACQTTPCHWRQVN